MIDLKLGFPITNKLFKMENNGLTILSIHRWLFIGKDLMMMEQLDNGVMKQFINGEDGLRIGQK